MKSRTKAVVIGDGIAECSTLFHLTQEGWSDVVLVEQNELTSGITWHSAAQVTNFGMNQTMVRLKTYSINLYIELSEDLEYTINYHHADDGIRAPDRAHLQTNSWPRSGRLLSWAARAGRKKYTGNNVLEYS